MWEELITAAASSLVGAMSTDAWHATRSAFSRLLSRGDRQRQQLIESRLSANALDIERAADGDRSVIRDAMLSAWKVRFRDLLEEYRDADGELRVVLSRLREGVPDRAGQQWEQRNEARDRGSIIAVQGPHQDIHIYPPATGTTERQDADEPAVQSQQPLVRVSDDEDALYQAGIDFLNQLRTCQVLRAYAPRAFSPRDHRGSLGPKERWIRAIGTALRERRLNSFLYVVGLPDDDDHRERVLTFLNQAIIDPILSMPTQLPAIGVRFVAEPAELSTAGGPGLAMFERDTWLLACSTDPSLEWPEGGGQSVLTHGWFWQKDPVGQDLARAFVDWFDKFALPRSLPLWESPHLDFEFGRTKCNDPYFRERRLGGTLPRSVWADREKPPGSRAASQPEQGPRRFRCRKVLVMS